MEEEPVSAQKIQELNPSSTGRSAGTRSLKALLNEDTIGTLNASKAVVIKFKADSSINIESHLNKIRVQYLADLQFSVITVK